MTASMRAVGQILTGQESHGTEAPRKGFEKILNFLWKPCSSQSLQQRPFMSNRDASALITLVTLPCYTAAGLLPLSVRLCRC